MRRFYRIALTATSRAWHRAICICLILSLLTVSTPAAPQTIVNAAREASFSFGLWYRVGGLKELLQGLGEGSPRKQEKQSERNARVTRIEISPGNLSVKRGERVQFAALAYGSDDSAISGVKIKWSAQEESRKKPGPISQQGEFRAVISGQFTITAEGAGQTAQVKVVVEDGLGFPRPGERPERVKSVTNRVPPR